MPRPAAVLAVSPEVFDEPAPLSADRLGAAVAVLDPGSRALLDLSLRWGVADERMARLLRVDVGDIARRRAGVIEQVAAQLGIDPLQGLGRLRTALADLPPEAWGLPPPAGAREIADGPPSRAAATLGPSEPARTPAQPRGGAVAPPSQGAPLDVPSPPPLPRPRGRTILALAVGAVLGAALSRRLR